MSISFGIFSTVVLGGVDHVYKGLLGLLPLTGLKAAVRVDPELLRLEELKHLLDTVTDLLLTGNTRGVDVVNTRSNVSGISGVNEDAEQLGIRLAVLNGQDVGIESGNGVEEVLELGVAEVRVDLSGILNASGGQLEGVDSPLEVSVTLLARAEGETLTKSRLVDLDNVDTSLLEVNDLISEGKGKLLSLDRLVNVVTRERPTQASDGAGKHTLHGLAGDGDGVLGFLDRHGGRSGDVTNNDGGADAARTIRLDPCVGGEGVAVQALTKVLNHVIALRLTVDEYVEAKLLLNLDVLLDLLLNELVVLLLGDLTLGELVSLNSDLGGLGERPNGGSGEERKVELLLLSSNTSSELGLALVVLLSDLGLAVLDLGVVGPGRSGTSLHRLGVSLELLADGGRAVSHGLGNDGNLNGLFRGERKPVSDLRVELLLAGKGVRGVKERAGGGNDDTLLAELLDSRLNSLNGTLEVGLPDVTAIDDTSGQNGLGANGTSNGLELLRVANEINVNGINVLGE